MWRVRKARGARARAHRAEGPRRPAPAGGVRRRAPCLLPYSPIRARASSMIFPAFMRP